MSQTSGRGNLFVVATPLGNLGDITFRAVRVLTEADLVLAEDTRAASRLFQALKIPQRQIQSLFDHNEKERLAQIKQWLDQGLNLALISEAGTPLISDPGFFIVKHLRQENYNVIPIPGPSAPITALVASGFPVHPFTFLGFLPRKTGEIKKIFQPLANLNTTLIFFERKNRVIQTLKLAHNVFGDRPFCLARELTKVYEEFIYGNLGQISLDQNKLKGEFTVLIAPGEKNKTSAQELEKIVKPLLAIYKIKEIVRKIEGKVTGWSNKELYSFIQQLNRDKELSAKN
ncbi:MAG: 16S rRNA (cytidine(1402)-2'-O)-methyltransferase [Desulfonauticus sp.]|nr:16S rRNA (cytidine(1402)-2'-O)-methyltransferase [Desulfonauticus sp.]